MHTRTLRASGFLAGALVLAAVALGAAMQENKQPPPGRGAGLSSRQPGTTAPEKSLFDRLGGTYAIAAVVDDFLNALAHDPVIMANPNMQAACERMHRDNGVPGLKFQITAQVIEATGGPYKYHGKNMKDAHRGLMINESEWEAGVAAFKATLAKFNVPAREQEELIDIVASTHGEIVQPAER
jgi:hemoglobin